MNMYRWIGLNQFSSAGSDSGWLTRNQNEMVSQLSSLSMNLRGPIFPPEILVCPYVTALLNIIHCFLNVFTFAGKSGQFHMMAKMQIKLKHISVSVWF